MNNNYHDSARVVIRNLVDAERQRTSSDESRTRYLKFHEFRFRETLRLCSLLVPDKKASVLDVGRSVLTEMLAGEYAKVSSLGFSPAVDEGGHTNAESLGKKIGHVIFDLNRSRFPEEWPASQDRFDLIVFAETIEHLTIAPEYPILFLSSLVSPGGILLVTTPNSVTISKRARMLIGKNPFEQIRLISENPGHFREYTLGELSEIGTRCGLNIVLRRHMNFYDRTNALKGLIKHLAPSFRDSLVIAFMRPPVL